MRLLKNGDFVHEDWLVLDDETPLPAEGDVVVSHERLMRDFEALTAHDGRFAVSFPNNGDIGELEPYLDDLAKVVLSFPAFTDGRAYSQARRLRQHLGFDGELEASGNVLPDQIAFMRQCGIDVFQVSDRFSLEQWQKAATAITLTYQRGYAPERGFAPADVWSRREFVRNDPIRSDFKEVWTA